MFEPRLSCPQAEALDVVRMQLTEVLDQHQVEAVPDASQIKHRLAVGRHGETKWAERYSYFSSLPRSRSRPVSGSIT